MHADQVAFVISQLAANREVFRALFSGVAAEAACWKPSKADWSLLEIACHLADEEREDFGARTFSVLADPGQPLPPIDPQGWVESRQYASQSFEQKVAEFLAARAESIRRLAELKNPSWDNAFEHPEYGPLSAAFFLENWLAHDYLHIRQINRRKYGCLQQRCGRLEYAGDW